MSDPRQTVTLSLISHTNVGKTTLARTLLRRDIGEVRDQPHVTDLSEAHVMIATPDGKTLLLWDTPGFGDTGRLLRRLKLSGNPIGWVLTQVWDRFADRPLWCSQQAIRNVQQDADVVLYLVNAAEAPEEAGYVPLEMEILNWIGKPVVVLLNQTGPYRSREEERNEQVRWETHLNPFPCVQTVLSLDAFARCWVQEDLLLGQAEHLLPPDQREIFHELREAWRAKNLEVFRRSVQALSRQVARACIDREELEKKTWANKIRGFFLSLDTTERGQVSDKQRAMRLLSERLETNLRGTVNELIRLHSLEGEAEREILRHLKEDYSTTQPADEGVSALFGGIFSGALGGLAADVAAGGLTFGGGALVGAILGAAGAGGLTRGYNLAKGELTPVVRWSPVVIEMLVSSALLQYLAVAHFGRGRGTFAESVHPGLWQERTLEIVTAQRGRIRSFWEQGKTIRDPAALDAQMAPWLEGCAARLLIALYPESRELLEHRPKLPSSPGL
jgi:hypothetical protein